MIMATRRLNRLRILIAFAALTLAAIGFVQWRGRRPQTPEILRASVDRGDIVQIVAATGTLGPTHTVDIGTQVSGTVQHLYVDFNSIVHAGQLLAELDPALNLTAVSSAQASLDRSTIALHSDQAVFQDDERNFERASLLFERGVGSAIDRDAAKLQVSDDNAQIKQDDDAITLGKAGLEEAQTNLGHCTIRSPIDGVVIARNVDEGQAVVATATAPTLFTLGADLTHLILTAGVDESDISKVQPGEPATFTVDAYPGSIFRGGVTGVRLNATNVSNVVTYPVTVAIDNRDYRLRPGMTASLQIEVARAHDALRVSNGALRFRPLPIALAALGQNPAAVSNDQPGAKLLAGGNVWLWKNGQLTRVPIDTGITDGRWTEVRGGNLHAGDEVVTFFSVPVK